MPSHVCGIVNRHIISRFQCILIDFGEASVEIDRRDLTAILHYGTSMYDICMNELTKAILH